jgi:hypothetical protein
MIKPTNDRKTRGYKSQQNTFGLLPGPEGTCPGATLGSGGCMEIRKGKSCPTCYVHKITRFRKNVASVLQYNTDLLKFADLAVMTDLLTAEFTRFKQHNDKHGSPATRNYRLHWAGDIFSTDYGTALRASMSMFPDINFWGYTRTLSEYPKFADIQNCKLYLSVDDVNFGKAYPIYQENQHHKNLSIAYLKEEQPALLPLIPCPADIGKLAHEGSCQSCRLCLKAHPIWFKTT